MAAQWQQLDSAHQDRAPLQKPQGGTVSGRCGAFLLGLGIGTQNAKKPLLGPLSLHWVLAPPDRRATDVDNVRKEAADALTLAGLWVDDSCKVLRRELFEWTDPVPGGRVLLTIKEMTNV